MSESDEKTVVIGFFLSELEKTRGALREIRSLVYEMDPELNERNHHTMRDIVDSALEVRYP